jgi:uncharacterized protein
VTAGQLAVIVLASALGATVKSVTGLGYPLLAVPLISLVLGVEDAVVVVAVPNLAANAYLWWESRDAAGQERDMGRLVGFGVVGAVIGTLVLVHVSEEPLLLALAATIAVFVVQFVRRPDLRLDPAVATRWSPLAGFVAGLMQGAVGVSGPVVATWLHGYRLSARVYVHSVTLIFGVTGAVQLGILAAQGQLGVDRLIGAAAASVPVAICLPLGVRLRSRLAGPAFDRVVLGVLVLSSVSLVFDALT